MAEQIQLKTVGDDDDDDLSDQEQDRRLIQGAAPGKTWQLGMLLMGAMVVGVVVVVALVEVKGTALLMTEFNVLCTWCATDPTRRGRRPERHGTGRCRVWDAP